MTPAPEPLLRERIIDVIRASVTRAQRAGNLPDVVMPDPTVERPPRPEMGDFASSFPLKAKRAVGPQGPSPLAIAGAITAAYAADPQPFLASVDTAPPGFLNFTLADDWVREHVEEILAAGPAYGAIDLGHQRSVQVEFVSANPTGPLHVGTGRNAALGDSLSRLLAKAGWNVQREYYYNDAGSQIANLHHSVWAQYQRLFGKEVPSVETDYRGAYVAELAELIRAQHGDRFVDAPEDHPGEMGDIAVKHIMTWIEADLARMRVHFDNWFSEAGAIRSGEFAAVIDLLRSRDLVYEREGAVWIRTQMLGDDRDRVLIKSEDGRPTYTATDIAYHYDKFFVRQFDRVIDIWGADHYGQVPTMKGIFRSLGIDSGRFDIVLYQLVRIIQDGREMRMGKRAGAFVTVGEVLDEVGPDAMRWYLVSRSADSQMDFDLDLARKQSSENPVFYVQYAHARLAKIIRDAGENQDVSTGNVSLLTHPSELALIRRMLQLPEIVELGAREMAPHHVPFYAYELARATQVWYEAGNEDASVRVLADEPALRAARLKLAAAARQVLANALDLIGVSPPDSM